MRVALSIAVLALAASPPAQRTGREAGPVLTEFRVFDGAEEVPAVRIRVTPSGKRGSPLDVTGGTIELPPAVYDVQVVRASANGVAAIKSVEGLAVMHYPDEGGRHLEVINLARGHGALQLRAARGQLDPRDVTVFAAGMRDAPAVRPVRGADYVLVVVPAGSYDVRIQRAIHDGAPDAQWLLGIDVPADRTRLKVVDTR